MSFFILDQLSQDAAGVLGQVLSFMVEIASFAGIFILIWGLVSGLVLNKWSYNYFLIGIIIIGFVGVVPAWNLITHGFPDISSMTNVSALLP